MLDPYASRIEALTPVEAGLVAARLAERGVLPRGVAVTTELDPSVLVTVLDGSSLLAADVVAVLLPLPGPHALSAIEKILGRPVTCLPAQPSPPPPPRHEGAAPPPVADGVNARRRIVNIVANPKRPGTGAHDRFALYREGMTVAEYVREGGQLRDVSWDARQGFVEVLDDPALTSGEAAL